MNRFLLLALLALLGLYLPAARAQNSADLPRTALLIGVGSYDGAKYKGRTIRDLPGVTDVDLPKMEAKLKDLGFTVTTLADPTLVQAKAAVDGFSARIKTNPGVSLFYFSGHGGEYEGKNYLIPRGASIGTVADLADEALSAQRVLNGMEESGAAVNLVFLDCCREDLGKSVGGAEMAPLKARGSFIGFATRSGDFADPEEQGSPYTRFLLKHLGTPGLSVPDMYGFVAEDVKSYSKTVLGEERTPGYYSELAGAPFYLVPGSAVVVGPAVTNAMSEAEIERRAREMAVQIADAERRKHVPAAPVPALMAVTPPVTTPAFSASASAPGSSMEGSREGETREFGGIEMVWCPAGEFLMGSPVGEEGRYDDETQHRVTLTRGFWMAKTECTQGQWASVMGTDVAELKRTGVADKTHGHVNATGPEVAMYFTSWDDAQKWLQKMNSEKPLPSGWKWVLPTEAQWEYACRAGTETSYAGELDEMAWYWENSGSKTNPVGTKKANGWGLHDMHGNVYEWCADWSGDYGSGSATDPTGSTDGTNRVIRGGSWSYYAQGCRAAGRYRDAPVNRNGSLGFRPALVPSRE